MENKDFSLLLIMFITFSSIFLYLYIKSRGASLFLVAMVGICLYSTKKDKSKGELENGK